MALTEDQLAYLRSEVGVDDPTDDVLEDAYTRLDSVEEVAAEVLRTRLANLLAAPASFSVEGYSENNAANITALQKQLDRLTTAVSVADGAGGVVTFSRLTRSGWAR